MLDTVRAKDVHRLAGYHPESPPIDQETASANNMASTSGYGIPTV